MQVYHQAPKFSTVNGRNCSADLADRPYKTNAQKAVLTDKNRKEVQRNEKQIFKTAYRIPFDGDHAIELVAGNHPHSPCGLGRRYGMLVLQPLPLG